MVNEFIAIPNMAKAGDVVLPTVFMPPLYFYFIYILKFLTNDFFNLVNLVIFSQVIISTVSIYVFYEILHISEKNKFKTLFVSALFAFFPINIYAVSQISSITLQIFLIVLFLYFLLIFNLRNKIGFLFLFSIVSGFLILIRGIFNFLLIYGIIFSSIFKKYLKAVIALLVTFWIISPYLLRNYQIFDQFVLTKFLI